MERSGTSIEGESKHMDLVIVGKHDAGTPPSCARAIAGSIDGAELHIIPDAGHLTAVEQPKTVAALLAPFFARCSESPDA